MRLDETLDRVSGHSSTDSLSLIERFQRWRRNHGSTVLLLLPLLIFMVLVFVVPIILQVSFAFYSRELYKGVLWRPVPDFTLENFALAFNNEDTYLQSIFWTIGVAFFTSAISIALSLPVAYFLARYQPRGKSIIEVSFLLPIFGDIFTLFAIAYAFTPQGPVNWLLMGLGLIHEPLQFLGSPLGVIIWMSIPTLSVLLIRSSLVGVDVLYEEAAQTMGANTFQTFTRITLPLAKRGIMGALLLSVSAGVGAYTVPLVLVGPYNNWLSNKINREFSPFNNYPMASALGVILTVVSFLFLFLYLRSGIRRRLVRLPRSLFTILNIYALLLAVIMIWPVAQLVLSSVTSDLTFPPRYFSLDAMNNIFWPAYFQAMGVSLRMGLWSTVVLILICLPAAYALERRRFPGRSWLSALIFVPAVFPTITYAIAIGVYLALYLNDLRGSFAVIVVATATGAIPLVVRTIQGSLATSDPVYEEAALVMGASPLRAFFRITLPLIAPGVITAGTIAFTFAATNFTIPWLMSAREAPVAVYIYRDIARTGFNQQLAIQVLVMQFIVLGIVQVLFFVFRKQIRGVFA